MKTAIISYSRPFKICRGKYSQYRIKNDIIPLQYKALHQKIIKYRDKIFAHSDIEIRNPDIKKMKISNKTVFATVSRGFSSKDFLHEIAKMKQLICDVLLSLRLHANEIKNKLD